MHCRHMQRLVSGLSYRLRATSKTGEVSGPGQRRSRSSAVDRWRSRSARQQGTHPSRSVCAITAINIRGKKRNAGSQGA